MGFTYKACDRNDYASMVAGFLVGSTFHGTDFLLDDLRGHDVSVRTTFVFAGSSYCMAIAPELGPTFLLADDDGHGLPFADAVDVFRGHRVEAVESWREMPPGCPAYDVLKVVVDRDTHDWIKFRGHYLAYWAIPDREDEVW